jgi:hypothetical protein
MADQEDDETVNTEHVHSDKASLEAGPQDRAKNNPFYVESGSAYQ